VGRLRVIVMLLIGGLAFLGATHPANAYTLTTVTPVKPGNSASGFRSVSCVSADACTAVGYSTGTTTNAMAQTWNGSTWSVDAMANPGHSGRVASDVSCVAASVCFAAGSYFAYQTVGPFSISRQHALVARKNGTSNWIEQATPNFDPNRNPSNRAFFGISCASPTYCVAAGQHQNSVWGAMAARWDGTSWGHQPVVENPGDKNGWLRDVWCAPASFTCVAAGSYGDSGVSRNLLEQKSDGLDSPFAQVTVPNGAGHRFASGVSCPDIDSCVMSGYKKDVNTGFTTPYAVRMTTLGWAVDLLPGIMCCNGGDTRYETVSTTGISCVSTEFCVIVGKGQMPDTSGYGYDDELGALWVWDGTEWNRHSPRPRPPEGAAYGTSELTGVSCTAAYDCMVVGRYAGVGLSYTPWALRLTP
jgi:hypothetical protein